MPQSAPWWRHAAPFKQRPSAADVASARAFFNRHAIASRDNTIDLKDFHLLLETLGHPIDLDEASDLLKTFDDNSDGVLQFDEFLELYPRMKIALQVGHADLLPFQVMEQINKCRTEPKAYCARLEKRLGRFAEGSKVYKFKETSIVTMEGALAVEEAIAALQAIPTDEEGKSDLGLLTGENGLAKCAEFHAMDLAISGTQGHLGTDGSKPGQRVEKFGTWKLALAESIFYGARNAEDVVCGLLVDDGNRGRPHRLNLLNPQLKCLGIHYTAHPNCGSVCVAVMTGGFDQRPTMSWPPIPKKPADKFPAPLPSQQETSAVGKIQRKARQREAQRVVHTMKTDEELLKKKLATKVEAKGEMTRDMDQAIAHLKPDIKIKIQDALQDPTKTVRFIKRNDGTSSVVFMGGAGKPRVINL